MLATFDSSLRNERMSSPLPWIIGGAAVGLGVLYLRNRQAQDATAPPTPCDGLAKLGVPKQACDIGLPIVTGIIKGVGDALFMTSADIKKRADENAAKNGAVVVPLHTALGKRAHVSTGAHSSSSALRGDAFEYANGCTPFRGSPGWAKCAEGTHDMRNRPDGNDPWFAWGDLGRGVFEDNTRDPSTGGAFSSAKSAGDEWGAFKDFPVELAPGELGYLFRGRPFKCPADKPPAWNVRDHRGIDGGAIPSCGPAREYVPPNRPPPVGSSGGGVTVSGGTPRK